MIKQWMLCVPACLVLLLAACGGDEPVDYSQAKPAEVITGFYQALYTENDLEKARQLSSERMAELIAHYGAASQVQRYVLGRYYDSVETEVVSDSLSDYLNNNNELRATVIFDGTYQGDHIKDSRDVVLIQQDGSWVIDRILDARYRP